MEEFLVHPERGELGVFTPVDHGEVLTSRDPTYVYRNVKKRIDDDGAVISEWLDLLKPLMEDKAFDAIADRERGKTKPFWRNEYISGDDARALAAMLRLKRPKRYVEIGSGNSTRFARWAIDRWDLPTRMTCIDPEPRSSIQSITDEFIRSSVTDVDLALFESLEAGDILFHDGSHVTFSGSDTTHLFLEIMPVLRDGVIVQLHDISLPFEYPQEFDKRGYNEQYMLAASLLFSRDWKVILPINYLVRTERIARGGGSFWLERRRG